MASTKIKQSLTVDVPANGDRRQSHVPTTGRDGGLQLLKSCNVVDATMPLPPLLCSLSKDPLLGASLGLSGLAIIRASPGLWPGFRSSGAG